MTAAQIVGELLSVALAVAKEASAADRADILRRVDATRAQLAALPSLALAVGEEAERRREEIRARDTEPEG
jgi:hypothetical protein